MNKPRTAARTTWNDILRRMDDEVITNLLRCMLEAETGTFHPDCGLEIIQEIQRRDDPKNWPAPPPSSP